MSAINWPIVFILIGVLALVLSIFQLWRKGGIDPVKLNEVAADDAAIAKRAGTGLVAAVKRLFKKG